MLNNKFKKYIDKKLDRTLPEYKEKYTKGFSQLNFTDRNSDFIDFWTTFNDEIPAKNGFLPAFCSQVLDFENSITSILRRDFGLPENFYALFNFEFDDYMFYDKDTDEVFLVLAPDLKKFINDRFYDKKWDSFVDFIKDQLNYKK